MNLIAIKEPEHSLAKFDEIKKVKTTLNSFD